MVSLESSCKVVTAHSQGGQLVCQLQGGQLIGQLVGWSLLVLRDVIVCGQHVG